MIFLLWSDLSGLIHLANETFVCYCRIKFNSYLITSYGWWCLTVLSL